MSGPRLSIFQRGAVVDLRLKAQDVRVLALLGSHTNDAGWCLRSQVRMAEELACTRSTVQRALMRLIECGYVEQRVQHRPDGGDCAHAYRVLLDDLRPGEFINEIDEKDAGSGDDSETPCPPVGTPLPASGQGGAPIRAPIRTTPSEREERETRARGAGKVDEAAVVNAAYADEAFMSVMNGWPTASSDGILATYPAWCDLTAEERRDAARFAATAIAQHSTVGRKGAYSLRKYLVEKRWKLLPAAGQTHGAASADDAPPVTIPAKSQMWFAMLFRRWAAGEKVKLMFDIGINRNAGWTARPGDLPSAEALAALVKIPTAERGRPTAEMLAWRDVLEPAGISFTAMDLRLPYVWVPSRWPPGAEPQEDWSDVG